jgi:hypothetical protein
LAQLGGYTEGSARTLVGVLKTKLKTLAGNQSDIKAPVAVGGKRKTKATEMPEDDDDEDTPKKKKKAFKPEPTPAVDEDAVKEEVEE